jgi:hypothetical protein
VDKCDCPGLQITEEQLHFLIGPEYGWSGTADVSADGEGGGVNYPCEILVAVTGDEARVCASNGEDFRDGNRKVFRISLKDGQLLSSEIAQ